MQAALSAAVHENTIACQMVEEVVVRSRGTRSHDSDLEAAGEGILPRTHPNLNPFLNAKPNPNAV